MNPQTQKLERFLDPSTGEVIVRQAATNESSMVMFSKITFNSEVLNVLDPNKNMK